MYVPVWGVSCQLRRLNKSVIRCCCEWFDIQMLQLQHVVITVCYRFKGYLMLIKKKGKKCLTIGMQMK